MVHVLRFTGQDCHFKDAHMIIFVEDLVVLGRGGNSVEADRGYSLKD
jgi:hypothetical protein